MVNAQQLIVDVAKAIEAPAEFNQILKKDELDIYRAKKWARLNQQQQATRRLEARAAIAVIQRQQTWAVARKAAQIVRGACQPGQSAEAMLCDEIAGRILNFFASEDNDDNCIPIAAQR